MSRVTFLLSLEYLNIIIIINNYYYYFNFLRQGFSL